MDSLNWLDGLAMATLQSTPVVFAAVGETIAEKAGIVNLSLNGTILLSALTAFAAARTTENVLVGFIAGALVGALSGVLAAFLGDFGGRSPLAAGFVLAFLFKDLAFFAGASLLGENGPAVKPWAIPLLTDIPGLGPVFFSQDLVTYCAYIVVGLAVFALYHTRWGLMVRCVGENPKASHARGLSVRRIRLGAALVGGALAGLAGPAYSLCLKPGWKGALSGIDGIGWIALAITVFGGWNPLRAALGAWLFAFIQWLGIALQPALPDVPSQVFSVTPFPLMIAVLVLANLRTTRTFHRLLNRLPALLRAPLLRISRHTGWHPPAGLGKTFKPD